MITRKIFNKIFKLRIRTIIRRTPRQIFTHIILINMQIIRWIITPIVRQIIRPIIRLIIRQIFCFKY